MLDLRLAAALSALPGSLGAHLLASARARQPSRLTDEVIVPADFDLETALALIETPDAGAKAGLALARGNRALEAASRAGITPVPFGSPRYPSLLAAIADPPPMLWVAGQVDALGRPAIAIVGSRAASPLSLELAHDLGRGLGAHLVVVSGLARGVDAAAHRGALESGTTVAVFGCGTDVIYPSEHRTLADVVRASGAVISEVVPGTPPRREHFPRRNRLISGLAHGVVVVEASPRSGSLITARVALDQGREVMAVPGAVAGDRHRGSHALIRDGAALVECAEDVLAVLGVDAARLASVAAGVRPSLVDTDSLTQRMRPGEVYELQQLMTLTGQPAPDLLRRLLDLELAGRVVRVPGGRFFRPVNARSRLKW